MKEYHKAMESYKCGLQLEPDNRLCKDGLNTVTMKINTSQSAEDQSERQVGICYCASICIYECVRDLNCPDFKPEPLLFFGIAGTLAIACSERGASCLTICGHNVGRLYCYFLSL